MSPLPITVNHPGRANADQLAAVLEDFAANGLSVPQQRTPRETPRETHFTRLLAQRPAGGAACLDRTPVVR
ncbi:hypothetical protein [Streptomyces canus]|uniref:hypothetical protein n=1 Tax=Streptomyces canus TaxID=58343 RepID=UPI0037113BF1